MFSFQAAQFKTKQIDEDGLLALVRTLPGKKSKYVIKAELDAKVIGFIFFKFANLCEHKPLPNFRRQFKMLILGIIKDMLSQNYRQFKMLILGIIKDMLSQNYRQFKMLILGIIKDMLSQNYRQFKMLILGIIKGMLS